MSFTKTFNHSEELFTAALTEFANKGYEQASLNAILEEASMSKGQFYYYFENKEALYFALIEVLIARKREFLAGAMKPEDFEQDIFTILETQIRYGMAFAREFPQINQFAESFVREQGNPIYKRALARYNFANDDLMGQLIARAYECGDFRQSYPLWFVKKTITFLFTHSAELTDLTSADEFEQNLGYLIKFMKKGLKPKKKKGKRD